MSCVRLIPRVRMVSSRTRSLNRSCAFSLMRRRGSCSHVTLNPRKLRFPRAAGATVGWTDLIDALKRQLATASTYPYQVCACHMCLSGSLLPELLGKPDENPFGAPDVAEPIRVFVLDHFADELRAAFAEPGERIVDVLHGEHDA